MSDAQPAKATVVIPVYPGVNLLDVAGPMEMFSWARSPSGDRLLDVQVVAETAGLITCGNGFTIYAEATFDDAIPEATLWTPGGDPGALVAIMQDEKQTFINFLRKQAATAPIVASVCEGAMLLAHAHLLDGYCATTHWAFIPCFTAMFSEVRVARGYPRFQLDRNRLTGGGVSSGLDEALKLIEILFDEATAIGVQQSTQYYPEPPVSSDIPPAGLCPLKGVAAKTDYGRSGWTCRAPT
jgi:transcriptional regulator GlxA family with amidase domain